VGACSDFAKDIYLPKNDDLRRALDEASKIRSPEEYRARLSELEKRFHHSIEPLTEGSDQIDRFNCFAYAALFGILPASMI
jgi:hypothetical protein